VRATALAAHTPEAVRAALAARGWEADQATFAATGIQPLVVLFEDITETEREALVRWGARGGADILTGDGPSSPPRRAASRRSAATTAPPPISKA